MTYAAELRRLADALDAGEVETPDLVMVSRVHFARDGAGERAAVDYIDAERPGQPQRWAAPYQPMRLHVDDGN